MVFPVFDLSAYVITRSFEATSGYKKIGGDTGMFSTFSMTAESVIKQAAEDLERDYSTSLHIRVQLLKDAQVIAERPLYVDFDCMSSYKRIIKMLVDNKMIRKEQAKFFSVEECPEGREAMVFVKVGGEKVPVFILAT
jgi:hypothetical protein